MSLEAGAHHLDRVRARILSPILARAPLRRIYLDRVGRLALLHGLFALAALAFALSFPLWQLLLGPALFGYAHLLSSVRHVPAAVEGNSLGRGSWGLATGLLLTVCFLHVVYRFAGASGWLGGVGPGQSEWQGFGWVDGLFLAVLCLGLAGLRRRGARAAGWTLLALSPILVALAFAPIETAGALILLHNLVGYLYWMAIAKTGRARRGAAHGLFWAVAGSGLLLGGALDGLLPVGSTNGALASLGLSVQELGQSMVPGEVDPLRWMRLVCALAFGQSCHYFVWLKAIPETRQRKRVPHTFRSSLRLLEREMSGDAAHVVLYTIGASFLLWLFLAAPDLRKFYFLFAGFHGLLEIAGLPHLLRSRQAPAVGLQE